MKEQLKQKLSKENNETIKKIRPETVNLKLNEQQENKQGQDLSTVTLQNPQEE